MWNYHNHSDPRYSEYYKTGDFFNGGAITVKFPPVHGKVELDPTAPSNINSKEAGWYYYSPDKGFSGQDKFVMEVQNHDIKVKIHYTIEVVTDGSALDQYCNLEQWKISQIDVEDANGALLASTVFTSEHPFQPSASSISVANAGFTLPEANVSFSDLAGSGIGQERNHGSTTSITLDTNGAGYGWFVDFTPVDNSEFLPTANTSEWIAKRGGGQDGYLHRAPARVRPCPSIPHSWRRS